MIVAKFQTRCFAKASRSALLEFTKHYSLYGLHSNTLIPSQNIARTKHNGNGLGEIHKTQMYLKDLIILCIEQDGFTTRLLHVLYTHVQSQPNRYVSISKDIHNRISMILELRIFSSYIPIVSSPRLGGRGGGGDNDDKEEEKL